MFPSPSPTRRHRAPSLRLRCCARRRGRRPGGAAGCWSTVCSQASAERRCAGCTRGAGSQRLGRSDGHSAEGMQGAAEKYDAAVVAAARAHHTSSAAGARRGRVLLVLRLRPAYGCSAFSGFPALEPVSSTQAAPRYVVVYAASVSSLLSAGLSATREALILLAQGRTLDPPAVAPVRLRLASGLVGAGAEALVASLEAGALVRDLLRPSPRHFFLLSGEACEAVISVGPEGDALRDAVLAADRAAWRASRPFMQKLAGGAGGFVSAAIALHAGQALKVTTLTLVAARAQVRKLRGLSVPRVPRRAARPQPTAAQLLQRMPAEEVWAHLELARSWIELALAMPTSSSAVMAAGGEGAVAEEDDVCRELAQLQARTMAVINAGSALRCDDTASSANLAALLDRWLAITSSLTTPAKPKATDRGHVVADGLGSIVTDWLGALRDADLRDFVTAATAASTTGLPALGKSALGVGVGVEGCQVNAQPTVGLKALLGTLDPQGRLPPQQIAFAVQSGSAMYNLATASSDQDFTLVFVVSRATNTPQRLTLPLIQRPLGR
jgi:hypothetical protein